MREVVELLKKAKARYPEVRARLHPQSESGSDNLRGLAAAANALQSGDAHHGPGIIPAETIAHFSSSEHTISVPPTPISAVDNTPMFDMHHESGAELLPRYIVKSIGPEGWREIRNADDWYSVLREKAFAVWADGVCNVLVELVDVPSVST
jgi:hypothetical protein